MAVSMEQVKQLREQTGAGMMDCKNALEETGGDLHKATLVLREKGLAKAASRVDRTTSQGVVEAYLHRTSPDYPPQQGVLIEVNCETDFVAKTDEFRKLAYELALHIAGAHPRWVGVEEVPEELVAEEKALYRRQAEQEGRPAAALEKIVAGRLHKFYEQNCLLEQVYVRDGETRIRDLIAGYVARLQENITVRRFARFNIKEP